MAFGATERQAIEAPTVDAVEGLVAFLRARYGDCITGALQMPARPPRYAPLPPELHARLRDALVRSGIDRLYSHQAEVWQAMREERHCVVVTPTASGKTLCYNLPVLHDALERQTKALFLFPTKALAQDQLAAIHTLNQIGRLGVRACTYDGDTPASARRQVRARGDVVVSNPDMLHQAILPHHTQWAGLFENLRYVVVDEMHAYRGVFGSHVANVLRRLRRVCRFYGTRPLFILCSATIANPRELAETLIAAPVVTVTRSGAPSGSRTVLLWNPPVINRERGLRASARSQTARIARYAVLRGLKTIVFARSRLVVEVLTRYLKDTFDADPRRPPRVRAYRGGYLPGERRETERAMREGRIDCIVTTSALELGIDVGALDVAVLHGYPGSVAASLQRLGRAGRRDRAMVGVLVASSRPLDQYLVRNPAFFLGASPEYARIDPAQLLIRLDHIRCAAFELPFGRGEAFGDAEVEEYLEYLAEQGVLHHDQGRWHWVADGYPANAVSLRSVAEGNFVVVDQGGGQSHVIAEVDYFSAPFTLYPGAIYMVQAQPWQVERIDWAGRKAFVRRTRADYYTEAVDFTRLRVLECLAEAAMGNGRCCEGEVHVVVRVAGYKKIRYYTHENIGYGRIDLPDLDLYTRAVWWSLPATVLRDVFPNRLRALDGFLGAAHALHFAAAFLCMAEAGDLGRVVSDADNGAPLSTDGDITAKGDGEGIGRFQAGIFLYDRYPGGIGLACRLYEHRATVMERARALVTGCDCVSGCPACVGPVFADASNPAPTTRADTLTLLEQLAAGHD